MVRLRRHGANVMADQPDSTALKLLLQQFESPLVLILVFGAAVSLIAPGTGWSASIILVIVLGSTSARLRAGVTGRSAAVVALRRRLALTVAGDA